MKIARKICIDAERSISFLLKIILSIIYCWHQWRFLLISKKTQDNLTLLANIQIIDRMRGPNLLQARPSKLIENLFIRVFYEWILLQN